MIAGCAPSALQLGEKAKIAAGQLCRGRIGNWLALAADENKLSGSERREVKGRSLPI